MSRPSLIGEDGEVRELTAEDLKLFRPVSEVDPGMVEAMKAMRDRDDGMQVERPKVHAAFRIAADVADGIRATGSGYDDRVERVLREALATGKLDASPDDLVGEPHR